MSTASHPSVIPCCGERRLVFRVSAPARISSASTTSIGSKNFTPVFFARSRSSRARSTLSDSTRLVPTGIPCAFKNVLAIAPPMRIVSAFSINALRTPILSDTFAPPRMTTNGLFLKTFFQMFQLFLHQETHRGFRHEFCDAYSGGVCPVRGAKRVVHIKIAQFRERLRKFRIVGFLPWLEPKILKQRDVTVPHVVNDFFWHIADRVLTEND